MNDSMDRLFADWLREGPDSGPREGLERTLAATRRTAQRPGWTLPERWIPMQLTMQRSPSLRPMLYLVTIALLIAALVTVAIIGSRPRPPEPFGPARNGALAYERGGDIYITDHIGGTERALAATDRPESLPVFSRQGDRVAYTERDPRTGIRVMAVRPDGTARIPVAGPFQQVTRFEWSSDGSQLVIGHADQGFPGISVAAADGSGSHKLEVGMSAEWPTWRPGTNQIAFRGQPNDGTDVVAVFLVEADGTGLAKLDLSGSGHGIFTYDATTWSTDGSQLGFLRNGATTGSWHATIADISPNGRVTDSHDLGAVPWADAEARAVSMAILPVWSPDSSQIAYVVEYEGTRQVALAAADGTGTARLIGPRRAADDGGFGYAWSPDGATVLIAFFAIDGQQRFWAVDVESGSTTEITGPTVEIPTWQRLAP